MANIDITDQGSTLNNGVLQLENGVAMDTTLRYVADQLNTKSQLLLATNATTVEGTLKIKTANVEYLDVEDIGGNNRFTISKAVGSQKVDLDFASNPTSPTDIVGGIRTFQDGVNLSDSLFFRKNGQATFTERVNVEGDSSATIQTSSVIQSSTTNANLVIAPNGTGALIAQIPDGTATGGNARGNNAVDLQTTRTAANRVAGGNFAVIVGGQNNGMNGLCTDSFIGGGKNNFMEYFTQQSVIVGGENNTLSNNTNHSVIGGGFGNSISTGDYSTISGGQSNTASTGTHATVVGGQGNTASSAHSIVIGGTNNISSGGKSIAGGSGATASGSDSLAIGTATTQATAIRSVAIGAGVKANGEGSRGFTTNSTLTGLYSGAFAGYDHNVAADNAVAIGNGHVINSGATYGIGLGGYGLVYLFNQITHGGAQGFSRQIQSSNLNAWKFDTLTTGATTVLSLDGTGTTNLIIPNGQNRSWNVTIKYVATVTVITGTATGVTVGDTKSQNIEIGFKRVGGTSSLVGAGSYSIAQEDASMNTATLVPTAGGSQQLALTFTAPTFAGGGSVTCRVVAKVELTEVAW